jgi:TPR repeat protein
VTKTKCGLVIVVLLAATATATAADHQVIVPASNMTRAERQGIFIPGPYLSAARVIGLAESGNRNAETQLGWMYSTGRGVPQDFYNAAKWYYRAAVQGQGWAQYELGVLYNKGRGVQKDYVLSYLWLNLSASQAVGDDRDFRARMRDAVAEKMTAAQVSAAQQLASAWYQSR